MLVATDSFDDRNADADIDSHWQTNPPGANDFSTGKRAWSVAGRQAAFSLEAA
ncbi:MAG TPA: hypothetical protein VFE27_15890 [Acidobacteriaceae bacterium]|jgi:hypothetical protein|nr:hypothetical protein [Acidobacteriaceae bacterium]